MPGSQAVLDNVKLDLISYIHVYANLVTFVGSTLPLLDSTRVGDSARVGCLDIEN